MSLSIAAYELSWVKTFFSGKNQLTWSDIEAGTAITNRIDQVIPWLKFLSSPLLNYPIVLPLYNSDNQLTWYGMASDDQMFSRLTDEIRSFIGPSYGDFLNISSELSIDDEIENALKGRFGSFVIKFNAQGPNDQPKIEQALLLYNSLIVRRPPVPDRTKRPFGKIRGDFDRALLAGNANSAQFLLDELKFSGRVDAGQQKCLEIRLLAGLGRQGDLARNQPLISSVVELSLPGQTLIDVIDALYETYIRPVETNTDFSVVLSAFKQNIFRPFGPSLFRDRKGIRHPALLRAFLLFELSQSEPSYAKCGTLLGAYAINAEGRDLAHTWCVGLTEGTIEVPLTVASQSTLDIARQAIADEDYLAAYELSLELIPNLWAYQSLLRCAESLKNIDVTQKVLHALDEISNDIKAQLKVKDHERLARLRSMNSPSTSIVIDSGWIGWAQKVKDGLIDDQTLGERVTTWSVDEYMHDHEKCVQLAGLIANGKGKQEDVFRDAFPLLVDFFVNGSEQPCRAFMPIYLTLIKILGWSGTLSADELEIVSTLVCALLSAGPSEEIYTDCVGDLNEIVDSNISSIYLDWGLNIAELLALYPEPDGGELRLKIFMRVFAVVSASVHRVSVAQREVLALLAKDYQCLDLIVSLPTIDAEDDVLSSITAKEFKGLIGIYTLTEGAGQRAKNILEKCFPDATVETNKDHCATAALETLAKNANVFVFAWKSSKHQAYFCVKNIRFDKKITLPTGKGAASIVRSAIECICG